jgi:hypothetical protein
MQTQLYKTPMIVVGVLVLLLTEGVDTAHGQMFGSRSVGQSLTRRPGPGASQDQEGVGTLQGTERFLRQNRRASDYVGVDIGDLQRFIGAMQARSLRQIPPTTQGLTRRVDRSETVNQPLPPARRGTPYNPRLELSFEALPVPDTLLPARWALDTLARSPQMSGPSRIAVSLEGRTAILRGEVPSEADRDLAELLLTFEPGISAIQNELRVNPDLQESEDSLSAIRQRQTPRETWTTLSHPTHSKTQAWPSSTQRSY